MRTEFLKFLLKKFGSFLKLNILCKFISIRLTNRDQLVHFDFSWLFIWDRIKYVFILLYLILLTPRTTSSKLLSFLSIFLNIFLILKLITLPDFLFNHWQKWLNLFFCIIIQTLLQSIFPKCNLKTILIWQIYFGQLFFAKSMGSKIILGGDFRR